METTDLARMRAATAAKRPADVTRAEPLTLHAVRAVRRSVAQPAGGRLARFNGWRRDHYVADQLMRVAAILTGGLALGALVIGLAIAAIRALIAGMGGMAAVGTALLSVAGTIAVLCLLGALLGRKSDGHRDGYGFHWTKCK